MVVAPAAIGLALLAFGLYQSEREQVAQSTIATARAIASALDRDLAVTTGAAQILAASPLLQSEDLEGFYREAKKLHPLVHGHGIVLVDASGTKVLSTAMPFAGSQLPRADHVDYQRVFETGQASVSNLFIGEVTKRPAVFVGVPVLRDDRVRYALGVSVSTDRLYMLLQNQALPPDWTATIIDASGVIVARSGHPEAVGRKISPMQQAAIASPRSGTVDSTPRGGLPAFSGTMKSEEALSGFVKSETSDWTVVLDIPAAQVWRQPRAFVLFGAVGMLSVLIGGLMLAVYESARISRAVRNLIAPALALGRGEVPHIPPLSVRETDEVAQALGLVHQLLLKRTLERDDAQRHVAERNLADEMFSLAVEACPNGMVMADAQGKIVLVNSEIERLFGYAREELIGRPVELLVPDSVRIKHALVRNQYISRPETRHMGVARELLGRRRDGTEFPVEIGLNPIRAGDEPMILSVVVDISQRKQEERLKDEFVATVSHELRTPLTSISGSLGLLMGQWTGQLPAPAARLLSIAHSNSQRLVRLVNDILDIEKIESGRAIFILGRIDLRKLAEQAIEGNRGFAEGYGIQVRLDPASVDAEVNADPDRLAQVITNLLSNAIKFSPAGGEVLVLLESAGEFVRVSVRDHGSGIPGEFRPHIFEKFAQADGTNTRQKGGTGLGLSIVKQIVERLGGQVGFEDAPGGGTIFYVDLPRWDDAISVGIDAATEGAPPRILLCEDDPAVARMVRTRLRPAGFTVDFAHTFDTAIACTNTNRYAAIIVDLRLRGSDGIDLILQIRAQPHHRNTPIVVISGDTMRGIGDVRMPLLNVLEWFEKPIDFGRLSDVLVAATAPHRRALPRILHVDDDHDLLALVEHQLSTMANVISVDGTESARRALAEGPIDLVVLDIALGPDSGLDLLPDLQDNCGKPLPVIIFSCEVPAVPGDDQDHSALSKVNSSLEKLGTAVRDRLALLPSRDYKEVA